jgi:6-phosphogluconolactonase (cycloisomerase 2 family)
MLTLYAKYMGGSMALYSLSTTSNSALLAGTDRTEVFPVFPYTLFGHGPDKIRQRQCHLHQVLEDKRGLLFVVDLGSDRIWIYRRNGIGLDQCGWLQCPAGSGPRHAVMTPDGEYLFLTQVTCSGC